MEYTEEEVARLSPAPQPQLPIQDDLDVSTENKQDDIIFQEMQKWVAEEYQKELLHISYWKKLELEKAISGDMNSDVLASGLCHIERIVTDWNEAKSAAKRVLAHLQEHFQPKDENKVVAIKILASEESLVKAFDEEYEDSALKLFQKSVHECHEKWNKDSHAWHSPYMAVLQSSGYGKSRMCKEFALQDLTYLTTYICLRETDYGYPKPHKASIGYLKSISSIDIMDETDCENRIQQMRIWIQCWERVRMLHYILFFSRDKNENKKNRKKKNLLGKMNECIQNGTLGEIFKAEETNANQRKPHGQTLELRERRAFWQLCEDPFTADELHSNCIALMISKELLPDLPSPYLKFLFVQDEASFLVNRTMKYKEVDYSLFHIFRNGLVNSSSFAVLVDTTSRLSNFTPVSAQDRSLRMNERNSRSGKLFPPFHWVTTMDVASDKNCTSQATLENIFTRGRPLWQKSYQGIYMSSSTIVKLEKLKNFAWSKLSCDKTMNEGNKSVVMASLAVLTGLNISPQSSLAEDLVASHMGTCLAISDDRSFVFIAYPQEPILSTAALQKLWGILSEGMITQSVLDPLISYLRIGAVNTGHNGEFVVKLLLLLAQGKAKFAGARVESFFEEVGLEVFLNALLGESEFDIKKSLERLVAAASYKLSFTCFCKVERQVVLGKKTLPQFWIASSPEATLKDFYNRNAAMDFPDNQPGADLLLPVKVNNNEFKYILVQVKNVVNFRDFVGTVNKLKPEFVFGKTSKWVQFDIGFALLINVGADEPEGHEQIKILEIKSKRITRKYVVVNGLSAFQSLFNTDQGSDRWDSLLGRFDKILHGHSVFDGVKCEDEELAFGYYPLLKGMKESNVNDCDGGNQKSKGKVNSRASKQDGDGDGDGDGGSVKARVTKSTESASKKRK